MRKSYSIAVLCHIFYEDTAGLLCDSFMEIAKHDSIFLFNICNETPGKSDIVKIIKERFPDSVIICTSNRGKDIGGKLALLQLFFQLQIKSSYFLFIHDKKSLQALKSKTWRSDLLKILSAANIERAVNIFQQDDKAGIVATKEYVIKEPVSNGSFSGMNGALLSQESGKYRLSTSSPFFVAGTMFWARVEPFERFGEQHRLLGIRKELEAGNILDDFSGTITHTWERLLCWIVTCNGFYIKGI